MRNSKHKYLIAGILFGIIVAPASWGLYGFYYIPVVGLIPGMMGLISTMFHSWPGYDIVTYLGLRDPRTVVEGIQHIEIELFNALIWVPVYGIIGFIIDIKKRSCKKEFDDNTV